MNNSSGGKAPADSMVTAEVNTPADSVGNEMDENTINGNRNIRKHWKIVRLHREQWRASWLYHGLQS